MIKQYRIAGIGVSLNTDDEYFHNMCLDYSNCDNVDMSIRVEDYDDIEVSGDITLDRENIVVTRQGDYTHAYYFHDGEIYGGIAYRNEYKDCIIMLRREPHYDGLSMHDIGYLLFGLVFHYRLTYHDGVSLHGSAISYNDKAIIFTAPSGVGKSTQANLWQEHFKDAVSIINDDKPALCFEDNKLICYGTPFSGKHHINNNIYSKVACIINVVRADKDSIERLSNLEAVVLLLEETTRSMLSQDINIRTMRIIDKIIKTTPIYRLHCTPTDEAVRVTYERIKEVL